MNITCRCGHTFDAPMPVRPCICCYEPLDIREALRATKSCDGVGCGGANAIGTAKEALKAVVRLERVLLGIKP